MASGGAGGSGSAGASAATTPSVRASLMYTRDTGRRQKLYKGVEPPAGEYAAADRDTGEIAVDVDVHDARRASPLPTLAEHGFELIESPTRLTPDQFYTDTDAIKTTYYHEVSESIKAMTGAAEVRCFHHQVRAVSKDKRDTLEAAGAPTVEGPAPVVHADYAVREATRMFESMAPGGMRRGRFLVVNAWRNIASTPIRNDHLAMCDARSVMAPDDFVVMDFIQPSHTSETYRLDPGHYTSHRWYYFPAMERSELLLFKQYDSDPRSGSRFTFHTSFTDRTCPAGAPPRESIEVRAIAFFPSFEPDTIPVFSVSGDERVHKAVRSILNSLVYGDRWPAAARAWAGGVLSEPGGVDKMIDVMVAEGAKKGHHQLDALSEEERGDVRAALRGPQRAAFEERARASFGGVDIESAAANSVLRALAHAEAWPAPARAWMRTALYARGGVAATARQLVEGGAGRGEHHLGGSTKEQRETVIALLLSGSFEEVAKAAFPAAR